MGQSQSFDMTLAIPTPFHTAPTLTWLLPQLSTEFELSTEATVVDECHSRRRMCHSHRQMPQSSTDATVIDGCHSRRRMPQSSMNAALTLTCYHSRQPMPQSSTDATVVDRRHSRRRPTQDARGHVTIFHFRALAKECYMDQQYINGGASQNIIHVHNLRSRKSRL